MKRLLLVICFAALAVAQTGQSVPKDQVLIDANSMESDGTIRHLRGNVKIETDSIVLRADTADYNEHTGEIEAQGKVLVKLK